MYPPFLERAARLPSGSYPDEVGQGDAPAPVRLSELLAALSLGVDLGFGQPMEHVLRQCRIALRLAELVDLDEAQRSAIYYSALLVNAACHADAHEQAHWFGDDLALKATKYGPEPFSLADLAVMLRLLGSGGTPLHRLRIGVDFAISGRKEIDDMIAGHARLARSLGEELGLDGQVLDALGSSYERWDGKGYPGRLAGPDIPIAARVVQLAEFVEVAHRVGGTEQAVALGNRRSGKQFDPALVEALRVDAEKVFHDLDEGESWDAVIDDEPALARPLTAAGCDAALAAIARFVDLKSPFVIGHSAAVADLVAGAAGLAGLPAAGVDQLRRAGLVAGFGRLGVSNAIWDKVGPLTEGDWERIRLHPQITERMLHRSEALAPLGRIAVQQRERLDGSGYPAGLVGAAISPEARLLAAADVYQALREPRPQRVALEPGDAADELRREARVGRLDTDAVDVVLRAAGHRARRRPSRPDGLTAREVEVLRLIVLGLSTKEIAARLVVAPKTVGNHIEHIYTKINAGNRVEASLYAMRHGLVPAEAGTDR